MYYLPKWVLRSLGLGGVLIGLWLPVRAQSISLAEALMRVEQDNRTVLLNQEGIEQALHKQRMQGSTLWPQVEAELSQIRQKDSIRGGESKTYNAMEGTLTAKVAVLDYTLTQAYRASKMGYKVSKKAYEAALERVLYETVKAYYTYAQELQRNDVLNKNLERDLALLDLAKAQLSAGIASPLDTMRAHARVLKDRQDLLAQELDRKRSELDLRRLLNWAPEEPLLIDKTVLETYGARLASAFSTAKVWEQRPEYQQALKKLKQLKAEEKQARGGHLPHLSLFASTGINAEKPFDKTEKSSWGVGARVTLPLFEGFRTSSDVLRAKSALRQQRYALGELRQKIEATYALAQAGLEAKRQQLALSKDQVALALEELEMAKGRFKNGIADNQALLSAQASLAAVEDEALQLLYQYALAWLDFAFEQGRVKTIIDSPILE